MRAYISAGTGIFYKSVYGSLCNCVVLDFVDILKIGESTTEPGILSNMSKICFSV